MTRDARPEGGRLHGVSLSPFVRKVRAVLEIKGIEYELVNVLPGAIPAETRALSPLSKIPVWEEPGWSVPDSSVIAAYLERRCPVPSILPGDPRSAARSLFWEEYADTRLVEAAAPVFFQRVVRHRIFKEPVDEALVRRHVEEILPPVYEQLEALFLEETSADAITIGGLAVWSVLVNLDHAEHAVDPARWPRLAGFFEAFGAQPPLARIAREEQAALASF